MTAAEKHELLNRLFAGEQPELAVGLPAGLSGDGLVLAVARQDGTGVAMQGLTTRTAMLIRSFLEGETDGN